MKKRKKIPPLTPEERAAWDARTEQANRAIKRLEIELATGKRPAADDPRLA